MIEKDMGSRVKKGGQEARLCLEGQLNLLKPQTLYLSGAHYGARGTITEGGGNSRSCFLPGPLLVSWMQFSSIQVKGR